MKASGIALLLVVLCLSWCRQSKAEEPVAIFSLEKAIAKARDKSPALNSATLGIEEARHRKEAARTDFFPKLSTEYSYTRLDEPPEQRLFLPNPIFGGKGINFEVGTQNVYKYRVGLVQPLFTGGAIMNQFRLEQLGFDIAKVKRSIADEEVTLGVKIAYFTILKTEKMHDVAAQAVAQISSHEQQARNFFSQEMIARNELLEAQVRLAQAQQDLIRADNFVSIAKASFNTVLRQDVNTAVEVVDILKDTPVKLTLAECLATALQSRPLMKEIALTIQQAQRGVDLAKSTYFPKAYLQYNYNMQGDKAEVAGTKFQEATSWDVTVGMQWTFWEWGKSYHQVGENRIKVKRAEEARREIVDGINLEVKTAYLETGETYKNIGVARDAVGKAEEDFRISRDLFNQQMATTTDVLDAQTRLSQAQMNYNNSLSDYHIAKARLEKAITKELK